MKHFLLFENIQHLTVAELILAIKKADKITFKDLKFVDLIYEKQSLVGVYVIFDEFDNAVYVGKTGSRAILERIAAHFDLREYAFMNSFLCALTGMKKGRKQPQAAKEHLQDVYEIALNHKLVFVSIKNGSISRLESILARELQPKLNSIKGKREYLPTYKIIDL
jgi:hypothetical protein